MAASGRSSKDDSSPEPDAQPLLVPSVAELQRPSIISLGEESRGLPGLDSASTVHNTVNYARISLCKNGFGTNVEFFLEVFRVVH